MSLKSNQIDSEEVITVSHATVNKNLEGRSEKVDTSPLITARIGKGEDAKNSIIWTIVTWCLAIPACITFLYFVTMWYVLYLFPNPDVHVGAIREHISKIWGVFIPIITLALGYLYGKSSREDDTK